MKKQLIFVLLLCLASVWAGSQVLDTAAVVRQVDSLIQVSRALTGKGDLDKALEANAVAVKIVLEKLGGGESAVYGSACFNYGRVLYFKGDFPASEKWYLQSLNIRRKLGPKHQLEYAQSLNNLGNLFWSTGKYEKAETFHLQSKSIREKIVGKEHNDYAASLNNLALLYQTMGDYEKAEPLHLEAKAIRERILGKNHPDYASTLANLALLYQTMGIHEKAEQLYLESIAIQKKTTGTQDPNYMAALDDLALLYQNMGNSNKSESLFLEVKSLRHKVLGVNHPSYATTLNNLAILYQGMGNYEKSEHLFLEASAIQAKVLTTGHPHFWGSLMNLALLYQATGNLEKSKSLYLEAKYVSELSLNNKEHPFYINCLFNLATLYMEMGDHEKAEPLFHEVTDLNQSLLIKSLHHLSEREMNKHINKFLILYHQVLSFAQISSSQSHTRQVCYDNTLLYKGFLLQSSYQIKRLAAADSTTVEKFNLLKSYERRLATDYTKPVIERDSAGIASLEEQANTLEKDLARRVASYGDAMRQVKWQEVQAALKPGEAALEFVHYRYYTPKATDSTMYAALLLRPGDAQPQFVPLFEEKELLPLLRGATGGSNFLKINALYAPKTADNKQKSLYELIWKPLENLLNSPSTGGGRGEVKTVYCAPSGLLHRLNLAAIPNASGKTFGDLHSLVLLGSTRQLVVPNAPTSTSNSAYLAGGIRYDADSTAVVLANRGTSSRSVELPQTLPFQPDSASTTRGGTLDYLPATAAEVREIGQTLTAAGIRAKVDTGFYATEEAFRQLGVGAPSPRIVHLATHGYFFPDPVKKDQKTLGGFGQEPVFKMSEHPMIRSGLILAGAKQTWLTGQHPTGLEDGILTAYEISQMNLSGTELVVLSACETGLGDIVGNEGVYGLQRAFKIAGAKYLVMSLWKVDDRSTREFMTAFYRHWLTDKQPVPQAFRAAQRELRAKRPGAYDWAGFVLVE